MMGIKDLEGRQGIVETMRAKLSPELFMALLPSLCDMEYNSDYESVPAWSSPAYRPYCSCPTMRRMEHRAYGYQCSVCGGKCDRQGKSLAASDAPTLPLRNPSNTGSSS